jgi:hypothetical protein
MHGINYQPQFCNDLSNQVWGGLYTLYAIGRASLYIINTLYFIDLEDMNPDDKRGDINVLIVSFPWCRIYIYLSVERILQRIAASNEATWSLIVKLKPSIHTMYGRHHDIVLGYAMSQKTTYVCSVCRSRKLSFPRSLFIIWFWTLVTRRSSLVEQNVLTLPV